MATGVPTRVCNIGLHLIQCDLGSRALLQDHSKSNRPQGARGATTDCSRRGSSSLSKHGLYVPDAEPRLQVLRFPTMKTAHSS